MRYRTTRPADLRAARDFIPAGYNYTAEVREALPSIWENLLRAGQLNAMTVEDADGSVRSVGLSVFVSDNFADEVLAQPRPYLNARLHALILAGQSPVLDAQAIAKGNSGTGLTLMPLHFATAAFDKSDPEINRLLLTAGDTFRLTHAGFRVKRMVKEVVGLDLCRYMISCGTPLFCDYSRIPAFAHVCALPNAERPYLMAVNHVDLPLGSTLSMMFAPSKRRFNFSSAEQKLLRSAILLDSEDEVAAELGLTRDTLRTQWRSIYERVRNVDPAFFPDDGDLAHDGARGRGKRRHLLQYLQVYMEELRPYRKSTGEQSRKRLPPPITEHDTADNRQARPVSPAPHDGQS